MTLYSLKHTTCARNPTRSSGNGMCGRHQPEREIAQGTLLPKIGVSRGWEGPLDQLDRIS